jgi:DNA modification methylase
MALKPYYRKNGIVIYHGDCLEVLPTLPKVDLVLADPPYDVESHTLQRRVQRGRDASRYGRVTAFEQVPFPAMTEQLRDASAALIASLTSAWLLAFCQIEGAPLWRHCFEEHSLVYKRTCLWIKPDGMPQFSGDRPGMGYETFVAMHAAGRTRWNGGGRHGVFKFNKRDPGMGGAKNSHPTQKPLALIEHLIELFSNDGQLVLDPFMGSGTTLVAAQNLHRHAIGIEIEEKYCEIAAKRLDANARRGASDVA